MGPDGRGAAREYAAGRADPFPSAPERDPVLRGGKPAGRFPRRLPDADRFAGMHYRGLSSGAGGGSRVERILRADAGGGAVADGIRGGPRNRGRPLAAAFYPRRRRGTGGSGPQKVYGAGRKTAGRPEEGRDRHTVRGGGGPLSGGGRRMAAAAGAAEHAPGTGPLQPGGDGRTGLEAADGAAGPAVDAAGRAQLHDPRSEEHAGERAGQRHADHPAGNGERRGAGRGRPPAGGGDRSDDRGGLPGRHPDRAGERMAVRPGPGKDPGRHRIRRRPDPEPAEHDPQI